MKLVNKTLNHLLLLRLLRSNIRTLAVKKFAHSCTGSQASLDFFFSYSVMCLYKDSASWLKWEFFPPLFLFLSVVFLSCAAAVPSDGDKLDVATPRSLRENDSLQRMLTAADCLCRCILSQVMYQQSQRDDGAVLRI